MHIMEGYLPAGHALAWSAAAAPFFLGGLGALRRRLAARPEARLTLAAAGAFTFLLSALKLPSVTGSSSHPTGICLGAVLGGPAVMCVLGTVTLLFQALLLAHGGLTTLGANVFSMAVVGAYVAAGAFGLARRLGLGAGLAAGLAAALADLATYATTALQLSLAFPDPASGVAGAFAKFAGVFALTQLPLAVVEGFLTAAALNWLLRHGRVEALELFGGRPPAGEAVS